MRKIKYIVLHCTATEPNATVESIKKYWRNTLKWKSPGYHYLIDADGNIYALIDIKYHANGVKGYNLNSIHLAYIGNEINEIQSEKMRKIVNDLLKMFPDAEVKGHCDFPNINKTCPNFNVKKWYYV